MLFFYAHFCELIANNEIITYSELANRVSFEINPRNIEKQLGVISLVCKENNLPPLSVMVVNKDTLMPGNGFYNAYCPEIKNEDERWKKCFELMDMVKSSKKWKKSNYKDSIYRNEIIQAIFFKVN